MSRALVVTTINPPTRAMAELAEGAAQRSIDLIIIGDVKSPSAFALAGGTFYAIDEQDKIFPVFSKAVPTAQYSRKNLGYLLAIRTGSHIVQETDDDNFPLRAFWDELSTSIQVDSATSRSSWVNVYSFFSDRHIWMRGFPLEFLSRPMEGPECAFAPTTSRGLIQQGLVDNDPDVDAIFRLTMQLPVTFETRRPIVLPPGKWSPFNSQNTIFAREAFPLLYLPSFCSSRMTDIWRSFVAQRCLWELDEGVVFHSPTVYQERNEHNLLKDFEDEVPGYLLNDRIRLILESTKLEKEDTIGNLTRCYESLVKGAVFPSEELDLVKLWVNEIERFC